MDNKGDSKNTLKRKSRNPPLELMCINKDPVVNKVESPLDPEEVSKHNTPNDCWCIYQGKVYDITRYLDLHPGGREHLLEFAGKDITQEFFDIHPWVNGEHLLESLLVGELKTDSDNGDSTK